MVESHRLDGFPGTISLKKKHTFRAFTAGNQASEQKNEEICGLCDFLEQSQHKEMNKYRLKIYKYIFQKNSGSR
jgi:hypothetical protein